MARKPDQPQPPDRGTRSDSGLHLERCPALPGVSINFYKVIPGCFKCKQLIANTEAVVRELAITAEITKVTDIDKITSYGVMTTPAFVVDGTVVSAGKLLNKDEIKKVISK